MADRTSIESSMQSKLNAAVVEMNAAVVEANRADSIAQKEELLRHIRQDNIIMAEFNKNKISKPPK